MSFRNHWPSTSTKSACQFAANGFVLCKDHYVTVCAFCKIMIKEWNENDDIIAAHRETCTFHNLNTSFSRDQEQPTAVFEAETFLDTNNRYTFHELSIRNKQPKKVEYAGHQARLDSYKDGWKEEFAVTPKQLSEAGFYYAGYRDCARCFHCGIGLRHLG